MTSHRRRGPLARVDDRIVPVLADRLDRWRDGERGGPSRGAAAIVVRAFRLEPTIAVTAVLVIAASVLFAVTGGDARPSTAGPAAQSTPAAVATSPRSAPPGPSPTRPGSSR